MYDVLIQCSSTGRLVPTGLMIDPEQSSELPAAPTRLPVCEACGHPHDWSRWNAILTSSSRSRHG
jgi:hypothetical protein